jgi:hypothetical protein
MARRLRQTEYRVRHRRWFHFRQLQVWRAVFLVLLTFSTVAVSGADPDSNVATVLREAAAPWSEPAPGPGALSALDVMAQYGPLFASPLDRKVLTARDLDMLTQMYVASWRAAVVHLSAAGPTPGAIDDDARREAAELVSVLPFLHVADANWSAHHLALLPDWLKQPGTARFVEVFALRLRRPATAWSFRRIADEKQIAAGQDEAFVEYLKTVARKLADDGSLAEAAACLERAILIANKREDKADEAELRMQLADILAQAGHPQSAAEQAKRILELTGDGPWRCRAAILRLKYLFEAKMRDLAAQEAEANHREGRCPGQLPQFLYVGWAAHRQADRPERSAKLQLIFEKKFSHHPLMADMLFAGAMRAMTEGDYAEAQRKLETIEFNHSKFRFMDRVKNMALKLDKVASERDGADSR